MSGSRLKNIGYAVIIAASAVWVGSANAHVNLQAPNGGEEMAIGSTFQIRWTILISHTLQNWDLWYSTTSSTGPWTTIVMNLPAGSGAVGSIHTYNWTVPDDPSEQAWVRVRMDNNGTDYYDVSNAPFAISTCYGDIDANGDVAFQDLLTVLSSWGPCAGCPADLDNDGVVGFLDLVNVLAAWGPCPQPGACCFPDLTCAVLPEEFCDAAGGSFVGDGTTCTIDCTRGACCLPDGSCLFVEPVVCDILVGDYQGNGVACESVTCP